MQAAITHIRESLSDHYPEQELLSISRLLISKVTGFSFTEILLNKNTIFSLYQRQLIDNYLTELRKHRPIQYVLGETEFCGLDFDVNEAVLIPRPETEELVEWIVQSESADVKILDLGTGSGCIPIALKKMMPRAAVSACDLSTDALAVARGNASKNGVVVDFFQMDILNQLPAKAPYDCLVSNPPYIPVAEKAEIAVGVKDFEPEMALFVPDNDLLLFYRSIALMGLQVLREGGRVYLETHREYALDVFNLFRDLNYSDLELKKDIAGNDRMVRAVMNKQQELKSST